MHRLGCGSPAIGVGGHRFANLFVVFVRPGLCLWALCVLPGGVLTRHIGWKADGGARFTEIVQGHMHSGGRAHGDLQLKDPLHKCRCPKPGFELR